LAAGTKAILDGEPVQGVLAEIVRGAALATSADLAVARRLRDGRLEACAVYARASSVIPELEGSTLPLADLPLQEASVRSIGGELPSAFARAGRLSRAGVVHVFPLAGEHGPGGSLELYRRVDDLSARERALARLAAAHLGVCLRLGEALEGQGNGRPGGTVLEAIAGALAAGSDEAETAEHVVRLAVEATGAAGALLWRIGSLGPPAFLAAHGLEGRLPDLQEAVGVVEAAIERRDNPSRERPDQTIVLALGEPPAGALQLFYDGSAFEADESSLSAFAARAAVALRRTRRAALVQDELRRSQTLIAVVGQAISQLSLAHTLETAVERVVELTGSGEVAVYLREAERLTAPAASVGLQGPHVEIAERLLELALGPFRGRGFVSVEDTGRDPRLAGLAPAVAETGIGRALLIPLVVQDEVIGALGVYGRRPRPFRAGEQRLLIALSSQLAVAVQNARLHERTKELGSVLERTLRSERKAARQLRGLFEISNSFARSLSLDATLDAVAKTMVELFDLDAAAIRMPDERGEALVTKAIHVANASLRAPAESILARPQPLQAPLARRFLRAGKPTLLAPGTAAYTDSHLLLEPFLAKGSTAAVIPMATPGEVLGTLTLLSLDPTRPLDQETVDAAMTITSQAALAIDNARLSQQQKDFAETMQRSLLPSDLPDVPGLELGHVYESSAEVEVGGDVYDFLLLEDGRLAVVLGDVTGKGIGAAADMAMAKFTFRALARSYPEPSSFLAKANEVVFEEIGFGKFITMLYVLVDPSTGRASCASAGHPPLRLVRPDGTVTAVAARGMALGIDLEQAYLEQEVALAPGSALVLYTDGIIEARRRGELYGESRLDASLERHAALPAQELAEQVVADTRTFSGGDLADDCAVVVLRLAP
ncbi:MAG TPA: SpoIIE family protein phosphatase, partial [Gaiellaceae bacterium]|nr:SpoIIE family protein phosphatase [Gaiellaceae bacterium]